MRGAPREVKKGSDAGMLRPGREWDEKELPQRSFKTGRISFNLGAIELAVSILISASHEGDPAADSTAIHNRFFHGHHAILIGIPQLERRDLLRVAARPLLLRQPTVSVFVTNRKNYVDKIVARFFAGELPIMIGVGESETILPAARSRGRLLVTMV